MKKRVNVSFLKDFGILIVFVVLVIALSIISGGTFSTPRNFINILKQTSVNGILAMGMAFVIISNGIDLSVGSIVALSGVVACMFAHPADSGAGQYPFFVPILIALLMGSLVGLFNGSLIAYGGIPPFIVTLGTQLILYTILLLYVKMGNNGGMAISNLDESYNSFVKGSILPKIAGQTIPNYVIFAILLTALMWFIWNKTTFGKNMFALGSNEEAARVSGVNVLMTTIMVFSLAGAMYGFTGFIEGARIGSNTANTGGICKISGIVIGVLMLRLIFIGLTMANINQDLQYLIKGGIILFACALDMRKYLVKK